MKYLPSIILTIVLLGIWGCEDLGEPIIEGCTDINSCNYNVDATDDDDSCDDGPQENYDCNGICTAVNLSDCCDTGVPDCNNECGGSAEIDECGVCDGDGIAAGNCDCDGNVLDDCSVCGGNNTTCNYSFETDVQPIFTTYCTSCHGTNGGLSLNTYNTLMVIGGNSGPTVTAEDGAGSLLILKLRGDAPNSQMPLTGCCLEESLIQLIETWIDEGALNN